MATFRPNALARVERRVKNAPVHRVMSQPDEPVVTRCKWQPPTRGELMLASEALTVSRQWCVDCWGTP